MEITRYSIGVGRNSSLIRRIERTKTMMILSLSLRVTKLNFSEIVRAKGEQTSTTKQLLLMDQEGILAFSSQLFKEEDSLCQKI